MNSVLEGRSEQEIEFGKQFMLNGGCVLCMLSVLGQDNLKYYRSSEYLDLVKALMRSEPFIYHQELKRTFVPNQEIKSYDEKVCKSCFGILQFGNNECFGKIVARQIQKQDFQFEDFRFNIKAPVFIHLTRLKLAHSAQQGLSDYKINQQKFTEFKDVLKVLSSHHVAQKLQTKANLNSSFGVNISILHNEYDHIVSSEIMGLSQKGQVIKRKKKLAQKQKKKEEIEYGFQAVMNAASKLPKAMFQSLQFFKTLKCFNLLEEDFIQVSCSYEPVLIAGRYLKYSRALAQTPWTIDGERKGEGSVSQQIVREILPVAKPSQHYFHAGGREDIDVRMLGNGRPFILELINTRRVFDLQSAMKSMESIVNKSSELVQVRNLRIAPKQEFEQLKESQDSKVKRYCCIVWVEKKLDQGDIETLEKIKDLKLAQKTPIRVLHR